MKRFLARLLTAITLMTGATPALAGTLANKDFHFIKVNGCAEYGGVTYIQDGKNQSEAVAWNCDVSSKHSFTFLIEVCGAGPNTSATDANGVDLVKLNRDLYCKGYPMELAGMWFRHNPNLGDYCVSDGKGLFTKMFVTQTGDPARVIPYVVREKLSNGTFRDRPSVGQSNACGLVKQFPMA